ncbi:MAG: hypothetical protein CFE21_04845 [Bacteroidetes bacterium B1(2017)]|nr:MAG: hypothetical protein CFE21_04845 [Bacteroidetes bacterium B1(2017)]
MKENDKLANFGKSIPLFFVLFFCFISIFPKFSKAQYVLNFDYYQRPSPVSLNIGNDTIIARGASFLLGKKPIAIGGRAPYKYLWKPSIGLNFDTLANPLASPNINTQYTILVTDADGCTQLESILIQVIGSQIFLHVGNNQIIQKGSSTLLGQKPLATGGSPPYHYLWKPAQSINNDTLENPLATPDSTTLYRVTVIDAYGSTQSDSVLVQVSTKPSGLNVPEGWQTWKVYPNPTKSIIVFQGLILAQSNTLSIEVFDLMGRLVRTYVLREIDRTNPELDLGEIIPGVYTIRIGSDNNFQSKKLIIQ